MGQSTNGQSVKLATLGTQDIRRRQANQNTHHDTQTNTNTCSINKKAIG
jgi:hypothetical protein